MYCGGGDRKPAEEAVDEDSADDGHVIEGGRCDIGSRWGVAIVNSLLLLVLILLLLLPCALEHPSWVVSAADFRWRLRWWLPNKPLPPLALALLLLFFCWALCSFRASLASM